MVEHFLAHKPVNSASLTDSFIASLSKLLKLSSWIQTGETQNNFPGPEKLPELSRNRPLQGTGISPAFYEHHPRRLLASFGGKTW